MKRLYCESGVRRPSAAGEAEAIAGAKQYPEKLEAIRHGCQKLNRSQVPILLKSYTLSTRRRKLHALNHLAQKGWGAGAGAGSATSKNRGEW